MWQRALPVLRDPWISAGWTARWFAWFRHPRAVWRCAVRERIGGVMIDLAAGTTAGGGGSIRPTSFGGFLQLGSRSVRCRRHGAVGREAEGSTLPGIAVPPGAHRWSTGGLGRVFSRVAIVNRGEAAMRLIHAVRDISAETGTRIETVALYTDVDRTATFV